MKSINWYLQGTKSPRKGLWVIIEKFCENNIKNDKLYLSIKFYLLNGYRIHWKNPKTFNEKLQWLKLYNHKPEYTLMADKYAAKQIVSDIIGDRYVVPCYGVWNSADDIDIDGLPEQFVLKCNHNSGGGMGICRNKNTFDFEKCKNALNENLKKGYYKDGRDKQYRDIDKKVIADMYLDDGREGELQDYKFWCFNGEPKYMYMTNKGVHIYENFYDMDFNPIMIDHGFPRWQPEYEKPDEFEEMKELSTKLSKGMPFIRIDFFDIKGQIYFGEFTFFDWGGFQKFGGDWDKKLGVLIQLPKKNTH